MAIDEATRKRWEKEDKRKRTDFSPTGICIVCERKLKKAPTELGWVHIRFEEGVCFDCIERLNTSMMCVKEAEEKKQNNG